jgi:hypothetical protein
MIYNIKLKSLYDLICTLAPSPLAEEGRISVRGTSARNSGEGYMLITTVYKKIFLTFLICLFFTLPSFAEKIPVKIEPIQVISTNYDEVEVGDYINFEVVKDVYVNDDLYIKKHTHAKGLVDFVHPNGWGGDSADIVFKTFYTTDIKDKKVTISYPLEINGKAEMGNSIRRISDERITTVAPRAIPHFFPNFRLPYIGWGYLNYVGFVIRGSEIFVEPDTTIYNIFIEQ